MTFADVDAFAMSLPGVTVARKWGHRTWMVGDRGFAWQRPFSKADLKRFGDETPPAGEIAEIRSDGNRRPRGSSGGFHDAEDGSSAQVLQGEVHAV
jgi:hypothetical protein